MTVELLPPLSVGCGIPIGISSVVSFQDSINGSGMKGEMVFVLDTVMECFHSVLPVFSCGVDDQLLDCFRSTIPRRSMMLLPSYDETFPSVSFVPGKSLWMVCLETDNSSAT